jgi:uncharacterized protein
MLNLEQTAAGVVVPIRAHAGARRNGISGIHNGELKVSVTQSAEKGKANKAILGMLGEELGLRLSQLELISGATSPQKRLLVREMTLEELQQRIAAVLQNA